jgi:hypothetical protein
MESVTITWYYQRMMEDWMEIDSIGSGNGNRRFAVFDTTGGGEDSFYSWYYNPLRYAIPSHHH